MKDMDEIFEDPDWLNKEPTEDCKKLYHAIMDLGGDATSREISNYCGLGNLAIKNAIFPLTYYCYLSEKQENERVIRYYISGPPFVDMTAKEENWKVFMDYPTYLINKKGEIMNRRTKSKLTYFVSGKWRLYIGRKEIRVSPDFIKRAYQEAV